ncbi:MAG TPA: hypothetical protein VGF22_15185 [Acidimicrobiales bacterium]
MAEKSLVNDDTDRPADDPVVEAPALVAPPADVVALLLVADELLELSLPHATKPVATATVIDAKYTRRMEGFIAHLLSCARRRASPLVHAGVLTPSRTRPRAPAATAATTAMVFPGRAFHGGHQPIAAMGKPRLERSRALHGAERYLCPRQMGPRATRQMARFDHIEFTGCGSSRREMRDDLAASRHRRLTRIGFVEMFEELLRAGLGRSEDRLAAGLDNRVPQLDQLSLLDTIIGHDGQDSWLPCLPRGPRTVRAVGGHRRRL